MTAANSAISNSTPASDLRLPQLDGVFVLNKPAGPSSAQCVAKLKRLGQKKIGHAGTLDPQAEGVLLILLGQATKLQPYLLEDGLKIYNGLARLGVETDTWDAEGEVVAEKPWDGVATEDMERELRGWTELETQAVPPYSAAKHQGRPLYKLARNGQEVPGKTKTVKILRAEPISIAPPWIRFRVVCGSGVYIRSLAHSLGKRLGCGAALFQLTREYSHPFNLDQASGLADVLANPRILADRLRSFGEALYDWPEIGLAAPDAAKVRNGSPIPAENFRPEGLRAILCEKGRPLALASVENAGKGKCWTILRGLWN